MMRARQGGRYDRAERPNGTAHKTDKVSRALQKVVPRRLKAKTNLRDMLIWQPSENFLYHRCNSIELIDDSTSIEIKWIVFGWFRGQWVSANVAGVFWLSAWGAFVLDDSHVSLR